MNKVVKDAREALEKAGVRDNMAFMAGGFGLCGIPEHLIAALREMGIKGVTVTCPSIRCDPRRIERSTPTILWGKYWKSPIGWTAGTMAQQEEAFLPNFSYTLTHWSRYLLIFLTSAVEYRMVAELRARLAPEEAVGSAWRVAENRWSGKKDAKSSR